MIILGKTKISRLFLQKLFVVLLIITSFSVGLVHAPVRAASIIIAASNATSQWKSQATAICDGTSDQVEINNYLAGGNTVQLSPGTFNISGVVYLNSNTRLYGQGNATIINLLGAGIYVKDVNNTEIDHLMISGTMDWNVVNAAITIIAKSSNISGVNVHDLSITAKGRDHVDIVATSKQVSNLIFSNIDANNPDGFGFILMGDGANSVINNITFYKCTVENAGVASTRTSDYITGFDFADYCSSGSELTVNNNYVINCSVNGAWESAFHTEYWPTKNNFVFTGCSATNAGEKPSPTYGYGFLIHGDTAFCNNTASSNKGGDVYLDGPTYTPPRNGVTPSTSTKTASAVNQGNCSGVIINLDSTHKELVLYSNDGNAVNQQIELGAAYIGNDGNIYSFNGTKIIAQFADYAIIRLVQTNISNLTITTGSLLNGTTGVTYSQTLTATGGTTPYNWSITSGTLPVGLTLSSSGVISGTPTTAGGPTSVTFKVADSASGTSTKILPITITTTSAISTGSLPNATIGVAYSQTLTATGGTTPYTWSIVTGALPAGLSLSSSGVISGTPAAVGGPISVTFKVNDSASASSTKILPITVSFATWDLNKDGIVNVLDMTSISQHWGETGTPGWIPQDANNDGIINSLDMIIVGQHWTP